MIAWSDVRCVCPYAVAGYACESSAQIEQEEAQGARVQSTSDYCTKTRKKSRRSKPCMPCGSGSDAGEQRVHAVLLKFWTKLVTSKYQTYSSTVSHMHNYDHLVQGAIQSDTQNAKFYKQPAWSRCMQAMPLVTFPMARDLSEQQNPTPGKTLVGVRGIIERQFNTREGERKMTQINK